MQAILNKKKNLRELYKVIRMSFDPLKYQYGLGANFSKLAQRLVPTLIGTYRPLNHQIIPPTILTYQYCYPIHQKNNKLLKYLTLNPDTQFKKSLFKVQVPITKSNEDYFVYPDVVLVPLLCFDEKKRRLGYGGGYFDATIKYYRQNSKKCKFIGVAVEQLKIDEVPTGQMDQSLDYVITENKIYE